MSNSSSRSGDEWRFEDAQKGGAKRQSDASILAREILKAYDRLSDGVVKCPGLDGQPVRMVKTDAIRDELKSRGFLDHNDGTITPASRTMLYKAKTMLLKDVRLVENEGLVWSVSLS